MLNPLIKQLNRARLPLLVRTPMGMQFQSVCYSMKSAEPLQDDELVANLNSSTKPFNKLTLQLHKNVCFYLPSQPFGHAKKYFINYFLIESLFFPALNLGIVLLYNSILNYFIPVGKYGERQTILHSIATGGLAKIFIEGIWLLLSQERQLCISESNFLCS